MKMIEIIMMIIKKREFREQNTTVTENKKE